MHTRNRRFAFALAFCTATLVPAMADAAARQGTTPPPPPRVTVPQQPAPPPPGQAKPTPPPSRGPESLPPGRAVRQNVKLDVTFIDSGTDGAAKKTLSLLVMANNNGQIRSTGREGGIINIDAFPRIYDDGISISLTIEYLPEPSGPQTGTTPGRFGMLSQSLTVLLDNGKPTVVTQSADPRTDRRVTVEVTATILK